MLAIWCWYGRGVLHIAVSIVLFSVPPIESLLCAWILRNSSRDLKGSGGGLGVGAMYLCTRGPEGVYMGVQCIFVQDENTCSVFGTYTGDTLCPVSAMVRCWLVYTSSHTN